MADCGDEILTLQIKRDARMTRTTVNCLRNDAFSCSRMNNHLINMLPYKLRIHIPEKCIYIVWKITKRCNIVT